MLAYRGLRYWGATGSIVGARFGMAGTSIRYPYTVPEGELWVMGDNRENSKDSRFFGSVPASSVTGKAFFVYWPLDRIGPIGW